MLQETFILNSTIAIEQLGYRAVLLTGQDQRNMPRSQLSENIVAFDYAPYFQLFPGATAIVHQGSIGTTAQALRAGRPMLIIPLAITNQTMLLVQNAWVWHARLLVLATLRNELLLS